MRLPLRLIPRGATMPILRGRLRGTRWITGSSTHGAWFGSCKTGASEAARVHSSDLGRQCGEVLRALGYDLRAVGHGSLETAAQMLAAPRG